MNALLDDANENKRNEILTRQLGISLEDLAEADFMIDQDSNQDGEIRRTYIKFYDATPQEVLDKIENLDANHEVDLDMTDLDEADFNFDENPDGDLYDEEEPQEKENWDKDAAG